MKEDRPNSGAGSKTDWRGLFLLTQLGISVMVPPVLCLLGANWLVRRFGVGLWIYIPALILGIGSAYTSAKRLVTPLLRPRGGPGGGSDKADRR